MRQGQTLTVLPAICRQEEISLIKLREKVKKSLKKSSKIRFSPSPYETDRWFSILDRILQMGCNYDLLAVSDLGF